MWAWLKGLERCEYGSGTGEIWVEGGVRDLEDAWSGLGKAKICDAQTGRCVVGGLGTGTIHGVA